ncbi:Iron transport multicopper oxidase FET5 [Bienertia sinuspersici]
MAYVNRPYGGSYYGPEREVIRDAPYGGAYGADYRVDEYGNRIYHHRSATGNDVTEVVTDVIPGGHHHHHYGRPAEPVIERREGYIVDNAYDPYRRIY